MTESTLTKYFRKQVEGTEQDVNINSLTDAFIKKSGGSVSQNQLLTHLKSFGFTTGQVLDFLDRRFGKALDPNKAGIRLGGEKRASPIDKFENSFNPGVKCAHCGMSRSQHGKGQMDHPFETRKQERDKFQSRLKQTEVRDEIEFWNEATPAKRRRISNMIDINPNVDWGQLTPAEQGSLAVWWDEGGGKTSIGGTEVDQAEVSRFLDGLRDSGVTNMFGAGRFVEDEFGISKQEAQKFLTFWMRNFQGEGRAEQLLDKFQEQFGEDAPQDAQGALNFLRLAGIPKEEAKRAITNAGGALESFYNYDGNDKLDSRADETIGNEIKAEQVWTDTDEGTRRKFLDNINANPELAKLDWVGLAGSMQSDLRDMFHANDMSVEAVAQEAPRGGGGISEDANFAIDYSGVTEEQEDVLTFDPPFDNLHQGGSSMSGGRGDFFFRSPSERANFMNLAKRKFPNIRFSNPAQLGEAEKKKPIGAVPKKQIPRLRNKKTPDELLDIGEFFQYESTEGQKFEVTKDGTMLPKGRYEVIGKKTDQAHSGPWGTFSITTVKNLDTGERQEIPTGNAQLIYGIEINQQQWDGATHSIRKNWIHKHVQGVFEMDEAEIASMNWGQLPPDVKQELKEQENLSTEFMDHGLRRQIERQIADGAIETQEQIKNIIRGSLGRAGVPEEEFDDMFDHFEDNFPQIK